MWPPLLLYPAGGGCYEARTNKESPSGLVEPYQRLRISKYRPHFARKYNPQHGVYGSNDDKGRRENDKLGEQRQCCIDELRHEGCEKDDAFGV